MRCWWRQHAVMSVFAIPWFQFHKRLMSASAISRFAKQEYFVALQITIVPSIKTSRERRWFFRCLLWNLQNRLLYNTAAEHRQIRVAKRGWRPSDMPTLLCDAYIPMFCSILMYIVVGRQVLNLFLGSANEWILLACILSQGRESMHLVVVKVSSHWRQSEQKSAESLDIEKFEQSIHAPFTNHSRLTGM